MLVEVNGKEVKLPDFFIVGAAKSGTTSLAKYLAEHPEVYISSIKEPQFFAFYGKEYVNNKPKPFPYIKDFNEYVNLFDKAGNKQVLGEASTWYSIPVTVDNTINNIIRFYKDKAKKLKFIFIIRNPIDRVISAYNMYFDMGIENLPLEEAIFKGKERISKGYRLELNYLENMYISDSVEKYIMKFGEDKVKIFLYEDLKTDPKGLLKDLYEFIGVDPDFVPSSLGIKYNKSGIMKSNIHKFVYNVTIRYNPLKPGLKYILNNFFPEFNEKIRVKIKETFYKKIVASPKLKEKLRDIFRDDILKLQELIGRDLIHWLKED